jgi:RNA polymerase sigma-70 factor (ECF subfamily)
MNELPLIRNKSPSRALKGKKETPIQTGFDYIITTNNKEKKNHTATKPFPDFGHPLSKRTRQRETDMKTDTEQRSAAISAVIADEELLISLAQNGDGEAFLRLYRIHAGHIYGVCLRILADETLAKDAAQQALIDTWQHLAGFRFEAPFSAWIHKIAVHSALALLRSEKLMGIHVQFSDETHESDPASHRSMQSTSDMHGDVMDLEDAISLLAPQMRTVLVLHDIEGYRHEEIGTILNIATGTSKAHLHRARMLVKEWLQQ